MPLIKPKQHFSCGWAKLAPKNLVFSYPCSDTLKAVLDDDKASPDPGIKAGLKPGIELVIDLHEAGPKPLVEAFPHPGFVAAHELGDELVVNAHDAAQEPGIKAAPEPRVEAAPEPGDAIADVTADASDVDGNDDSGFRDKDSSWDKSTELGSDSSAINLTLNSSLDQSGIHQEVEDIVGKRIMPDRSVQYMVRWLGHGMTEDSWVDSRNVNCDWLIAKYEAEYPGEVQYMVEKVLRRKRGEGGKVLYEIKWDGYGEDENTWEPKEYLPPALVEEFKRNLELIDVVYRYLE